jgi:hypothetical protein
MSNYETDFYDWTKAQADALRRRAANALDWDNLAEEIETLGRSDRHQIESRLENLVLHLLKWRYQPEQQCGGWRGSIFEARHRLERLVSESPSVRSYPAEYLAKAYPYARRKALDEAGLSRLPDESPWTIEEILSPDFLP